MWKLFRTIFKRTPTNLFKNNKINLIPLCAYTVGSGFVAYYMLKKPFIYNVYTASQNKAVCIIFIFKKISLTKCIFFSE